MISASEVATYELRPRRPRPELVAPMQGLEQRVEGMLVLGPRLSEEPYAREDRDLISSVASQAGAALQNFRLARAMAERMEAERLAGRELEIAREVQAKLLPQRVPAIESLDYAGTCIQARQVGGDYYDFLYLGPGRLGLVLADVSGKGISAALLMASLQASLRSQYAQTPDDIPAVLRAVNRTFYDSTPTSRYRHATGSKAIARPKSTDTPGSRWPSRSTPFRSFRRPCRRASARSTSSTKPGISARCG